MQTILASFLNLGSWAARILAGCISQVSAALTLQLLRILAQAWRDRKRKKGE